MNVIANIILSLSFVISSPPLYEDRILVLFVTDTSDRPVTNISITCTGDCSQARSVQGKVRIKLPPQTRPGESLSLQIVKLTRDPDWVLISPWNSQIVVPSFENSAGNAIQIVVGRKGSKEILTSPITAQSIARRIVQMERNIGKQISQTERRILLKEQADNIGASPEKIGKAISEWGKNSPDPYKKGLAAYSAGNYSQASKFFAEAIKLKKPASKEISFEYEQLLRMLGRSLLYEKKFSEALDAHKELLKLTNYDDKTLKNVISQLTYGKQYEDAEILSKKRIELVEKFQVIDLNKMTDALSDLGHIYYMTGRYSESESEYLRMLDLHEKCDYCRPDLIASATSGLSFIAIKYSQSENYSKAEELLKIVLKNEERYYGPRNNILTTTLTSLAKVCYGLKKYDEAESLYKRAVDIVLLTQTDHYEYSHVMFAVAEFYSNQKRFGDANTIYKQLLTYLENKFGKGHAETVTSMRFLARTYRAMTKYSESEALFKQALVIAEKTLASDSEHLGVLLLDYGLLYKEINRYSDAEAMLKRAIPILDECKICGTRDVELLTEYAELLRMMNRADEAKEYDTKTQSIKDKKKGK